MLVALICVSVAATMALGAGWVAALQRRRARVAEQQASREARELQVALEVRDGVLDRIGDGVLLVAHSGEVLFANGKLRELLGRRVDRLADVSPPELQEAIREAIVDGSAHRLELQAAGTLLATITPVGPASALAILRDVTTEHLAQSIRTDFVSNASHELKTPVSSILALTETLREAGDADPGVTERFLALLEQDVRRLSRLVTSLLDLSRLESQPLPNDRVRLDLVVQDEAHRLERHAATARLHLVVDRCDEATVVGSESDLGLLVNNLLDNAIHYSSDRGDVRVSLARERDVVTFAVSDTGIGIGSRDLDRIFERFYRADPARSRQTGGTGLGLSIVKHIAEAHGGGVSVQSVLGAGSTFTVRLPLADPAPA
jgi:two-component system, OmpR family, sensor histidine kinase SenX3